MTEPERYEKQEKWRRDPVGPIIWAAIFIWVGLVFLAHNLSLFSGLPFWNPWALCFAGAGTIILIGAFVRLAMPERRSAVMGNVIFGLILLGVGLGWMVGWGIFWPLLVIIIGIVIIVGSFFRRR